MLQRPLLRVSICFLTGLLLFSLTASARDDGRISPEKKADEPVAVEKPSWGHRIVWYVPNRVLDISDMLRLRFRYGTGWAGHFRLGEPISAFGGSYKTRYVGFPGPRYPDRLKTYYGREEYKGLVLSLVDATDEGNFEPEYKFSEFGLGAQLKYVGLDLCTDPFEWMDFFGGILFLDPRGDDL